MHKKKFSYALVISALAISVVFISSTSATALSYTVTTYDGHISYETLLENHAAIAESIDPASWPDMYKTELDSEMEDGDPVPDSFSTLSWLIIKYKTTSYVFEGGAPSTWAELNDEGIYGISSYTAPVPEPATILLIGTGLAAMSVFGWRRSKKKL